MNKHNPVTATYYLLIKKYERNTDQNLVFGKFTRDKRLQEQVAQNEKRNSTKANSNGSTGSIIVKQDQTKGGNSNSIAVIQEHYADLAAENEDGKNLRMNTQPKSEQKFRSQTNENINRNKRINPSILLASNTLSNRGTSNPLGAKKRKANQFLEQTLANQKFN